LAVKKFGEKAAAKDWQKKLWRILTCIDIANHLSTIKSPKQFQNHSFARHSCVSRPHFGAGRYHFNISVRTKQ